MNERTGIMARKWRIWALAGIIILAAGGTFAYETYERQQKSKVWEELLSGSNCDTCAVRKQGIAKKQAERRAQEALNAEQSETE